MKFKSQQRFFSYQNWNEYVISRNVYLNYFYTYNIISAMDSLEKNQELFDRKK